ncbi:MAG: acyl-CoA dehydrogenase family protein [Aridibacter famidurans]|nr:acyl-CoA dehydrogenase family protein [Aridibacter famidurans]
MKNEPAKVRGTDRGAVSAAAALRPTILKARMQTESERKIPDELVAELTGKGMFRLALPTSLGGTGTSAVEMLEILEELAKAEASVAWVVWNNVLPCLFARFLDDEARARIFADPEAAYASSTRPTGKVVVEKGGYRVSGRWSLVSGCLHANWTALMCVVEEDGQIRRNDAGLPELRLAFLPSSSLEIIDTWNVGGLRGTGSHDVGVQDEAVEDAMTFFPTGPGRIDEPIGRIPIVSMMAAGHAAMCLGICQASIDAVTELAQKKVTVDPVPDLRDKPVNQYAVAAAEAKTSALRGHLKKTTGIIWDKALAKKQANFDEISRLWSAANVTSRECKSLVDELYEVAGTSALYTDSLLERFHRDIHAFMQHIVVQRHWMENAGRTFFGLEPEHPLFAV